MDKDKLINDIKQDLVEQSENAFAARVEDAIAEIVRTTRVVAEAQAGLAAAKKRLAELEYTAPDLSEV